MKQCNKEPNGCQSADVTSRSNKLQLRITEAGHWNERNTESRVVYAKI